MKTDRRLIARVITFLAFAALVGAACRGFWPGPPAEPQAGGTSPHYLGVVRTEWRSDGRTMTLLDDFTFVDAANRRWTAPKGSEIDGASIPKVLWSTGGPYEGTYRDASVVHDFYCDEKPKSRTWRAVHRMFYDAMRASDVDSVRALFMYGAVFRHGPRWPDPGTRNEAGGPPRPPDMEEDLKSLEVMVREGDVKTLEEIERLPQVLPPK